MTSQCNMMIPAIEHNSWIENALEENPLSSQFVLRCVEVVSHAVQHTPPPYTGARDSPSLLFYLAMEMNKVHGDSIHPHPSQERILKMLEYRPDYQPTCFNHLLTRWMPERLTS